MQNPIEVILSPNLLVKAQERSAYLAEIKKNDPNSIRKGSGAFLGAIGELVVITALGPEAKSSLGEDVFQYDLSYRNKKYEVKSKKRTTNAYYKSECSVHASNPNQSCDFYVFVSVIHEKGIPTKAQILGYTSKSNFFKNAKFHLKGTLDTNRVESGEFFQHRQDTYNVYAYQLEKQFTKKVAK